MSKSKDWGMVQLAKDIADNFRVEVDYIQFHDPHIDEIRRLRWNSIHSIALDIANQWRPDDPMEFLKDCGFFEKFH